MRAASPILIAALAMVSPALAQDPHAGHDGPAAAAADAPADGAEPPPIPIDHDADRYYPRAAMDAARAQLQQEHGRITWSKVMFEKLEVRPGSGPTGYAWEARASFGGDINRFVLKSRGDGDRKLDRAEVDALWGRAISPWFNLEVGLRQDLQRHGRSYATLGIDGLAPYDFDVNAALFLSQRGDVSARLEGAHDYRLTQRTIVEPRAEMNLAAQDVRDQGVGSGLSSVELGLRLRYAVTPEFEPYIGVEHRRDLGRTAKFTRATGRDARDTRFVVGLRTWF